MPQSSKDSQGGKNHPAKDNKSSGKAASRSSTAPERNPNSPTGSHNRGEKKTTP